MVVANNAYAQRPQVYPLPERPRSAAGKKSRQSPRVARGLRRGAAGVLVVLLALVVVYRYGIISEINIQINQQTKTRDSLLDEQRHLKITISELTALSRLERVAIEELGMKYPAPSQIRYVGGNSSEGRDGDGG